MKKSKHNVILLLHNIRSVQNVASIFRTADAANVSKIFLTGYTPAPIDRFGRVRKDFIKVSLGAERSVVWEVHSNIFALIRSLKADGTHVISVEQAPLSIDYKTARVHFPVALVYGNEVTGLPKKVLDISNNIVEIPMKGGKESLNVSVSVGISLFRLLENGF